MRDMEMLKSAKKDLSQGICRESLLKYNGRRAGRAMFQVRACGTRMTCKKALHRPFSKASSQPSKICGVSIKLSAWGTSKSKVGLTSNFLAV